MDNRQHITPLRFPLITKILFAFGVIILFMILAGLIIVLGLEAEDQMDSQVVPLVHYLETILEAEDDAVQKCLATRNPLDRKKLALTMSQFRLNADSLERIIGSRELQPIATQVLALHDRYDSVVNRQIDDRQMDPRKGSSSLGGSIRDSILHSLHTIKEAHLAGFIKAYQKDYQRLNGAKWSGLIILTLAIVFGSVWAFLIARTLTRPLQSLMAGTKRVAEGQYESLPITTKDEVADLTRYFNEMSSKLKQLDEMRMQMLSEISHEMRTPLQVIKAGCYSIIHTKDGPTLTQRQRDAVGMIHQSTNRINQFINLFLDVAKLEAGLMKFSFESINLIDLLNPLVQEAQLIAQTRQIALQFVADQIPPLMIDRERMAQVFSNLLSNALKYTPDSGLIKVCVAKLPSCDGVGTSERGCVQIDVQDTGVGIPEADLGKLFNKFYQAKNVPLVNEKGSGLGLALVKHVVEAHHGRVSVKSQVGIGSTFTVLLPA